MTVRPLHLLRALLPLVLAACTRAAAPDLAADEQAIAAVRTQFEAAENASDIAQVRAAFAADIQLMAPNAPAAVGIDSAVARLQRTFDAGRLAIRYESEEIVVFGDWGFDRGTYRFTMTPASGAAPSSQTGKYLWISQRQADGSWKLSRVTWNGNGG
jgi:ketosteroid isomerase-like protein